MSKYDKNIDSFKYLESPFEQSDEAVWEKIEARTEGKSSTKRSILKVIAYAAAASIVLLTGIGIFLQAKTESIHAKAGEQISHILPDGSKVLLNAGSSINYHPYRWSFSRELSLEGEAFFDVKKGEQFTVISKQGRTLVLGTSFNIYARKANYRVFCKNGKVRVETDITDKAFVLHPGETVKINQQDKIAQKQKTEAEKALAWKINKFHFSDAFLHEVFEETERQFDIKIVCSEKEILQKKFTGYFDKPQEPEKTLDLICSSFNLNFAKAGNNKFVIKQK